MKKIAFKRKQIEAPHEEIKNEEPTFTLCDALKAIQCKPHNIDIEARTLALKQLTFFIENKNSAMKNDSFKNSSVIHTINLHALEIEEALYDYTNDFFEYQTKLQCILWNIVRNYNFIMESIKETSQILPFLEDFYLATGTSIELDKQKYLERVMQNQQKIRNSEFTKCKNQLELCPLCKSSNVTVRQAQTRGADEGMDLIFNCMEKNCGHHWVHGK